MSAKSETFAKYKLPSGIFVETGSYLGDGIRRALDAEYNEIYSIELSLILCEKCWKRFEYQGGLNNIHILHGDSKEMLPVIMERMIIPSVIWLDAHYSGGITAQGDENSPLLKELEIIGEHKIKDHTILIDDLRGWYHETHGFDTLDLMRKILEINPHYKFTLEDGYDFDLNEVYPKDILVAYVNPTK